MRKRKATIVILTLVSTLAIAAIAFAHGGFGRHMGGYSGSMMGPGGGGSGCPNGPGYGPQTDGGPGYGPGQGGCDRWQDLPEEDAAKIEEARNRFLSQTQELRQAIDEKQSAVRSEMAKDSPDEAGISKMVEELSALEAEFDQIALKHRLEMRKLVPEEFRGKGSGRRGGGRGRGNCW